MKSLITLLAALAAFTAALLGGCGGGVGTGGTGGFAQGAITGFGSVIVNGVHYDDSGASVSNTDGGAATRDDLRLGMTVEIESDEVVTTAGVPAARATSIRYASEMVGVLSSVDANAGLLHLLGQTVAVDAATVFDDRLVGGLQALARNDRVEIHAAWDPATQRYRATRVEPGPAAGNFRLRGVVSALNTAAGTVTIGTGGFRWSGATPAGLVAGAFVRVQVQAAAADTAVWTLLGAAPSAPPAPEGREGRVAGIVSSFVSIASFSVNGVAVDASAATLPQGRTVAAGVRVKVEGRFAAGVLKATQVEIQTEDERAEDFELEGAITAGSLNRSARTFVVRRVTVNYASASFSGGTADSLGDTSKVSVKGRLSSDGTKLDARQVELH